VVDHVIPHVPVRQWVLSLPIPLRLLLAAQPKLVTPLLQVVHRVITRHLLGQAGLKPDEADSGAVTLIQSFGSAPTSTFTCTAWCWTACTGAVPTVCRSSSKPRANRRSAADGVAQDHHPHDEAAHPSGGVG